ncbi:unnamed protein product [Rotaria magnacalcarata]|uniref:Piwi domain-containing protein n=1 Tax=Rotaria magnacalcarata TaxID=392030 RepID=A0A816AZS4_9BILA|nr:unnamed protein product [Rotaria magnacalcarata]CAF5222025.1 unnamed protein product [Rotaria magnacalcarata]
MIKDFHIYVGELMREFFQHNLRLPNKLVFYQVDLGNESFQTVLDHELKAIEEACQGKYDCSTMKSSKQMLFFSIALYVHNQIPRICIVLVKKHHNTRFFSWDDKSNQVTNVPPG